MFMSLRKFTAEGSRRILARKLRGNHKYAASVILVTRNQATYLNLILAALERQTLHMSYWEVIAVDNASQDDTPGILNTYEEHQRLILSRHRCDLPCGKATLLNHALRAAQGRVLVFLSDDRLVFPDFLLRHLLLHQEKACVVIGDDHCCIHTHLFAPDEPALIGTAPNPILRSADLQNLQQTAALMFEGETNYAEIFAYFDSQRQPVPFPWACFTTANASVPREAIERIGGFDEYFCGWGVEDTDLAYRLHQAGLGFQFAPKAITLRQMRSHNVGQKQDLKRNLSRFLCKHSQMTALERDLVVRGSYTPTG